MHSHGMGKMRELLVCGAAALFGSQASGAADEPDRADERARMVDQQIAARDISDARVLGAMRKVPRHRFIPDTELRYAYADTPLPIGEQQTISQPYIVALMTQLARPSKTARALEIGTGSGYQAAVLAELVDHVYTIELEPTLAARAALTLKELGYANITARAGDGYSGWAEHAPFDIIIVTAAPDHVPPALIEQLKPGGRMVVPVGAIRGGQELLLLEKDLTGKISRRSITPVRFVPLRRSAPDRAD
jgi:protein-L-isoaspartate(D-aspartate) O-methyltransferase